MYYKCKVNFTCCFKLHLYKGDEIIKNRITDLRKENKITQQELAEKLMVSRQTIISLENGKYNPSIMLAYKVAKCFGLNIEDVFIFEEE